MSDLSQSKYRPDIDGLRAIAIILVVLYHAFPTLIRGGFIGVDIFFVISGFLITSIILNNLEDSNFSLKLFYARRIKRIFPALILVIVFSIIVGFFILLSDEYSALGKNVIAGSTFLSNFLLWQQAGYFDTASYTKPLLHLWSLAIEEQFYIFWPLALGFIWKRNIKQRFLFIIAVVGIFSFFLNVITLKSNPVASFYLPYSRFWELMIGGILAYLTLYKQQFTQYFKDSEAASIVGFLLIIVGLIFSNQSVQWPGWLALFPTAGAFFLILAQPSSWLNKNVLSNKFFVWVGLISYPLYLWHWSLLSFARIVFGQTLSVKFTLLIIIVGLVFSWMTYKFIEKPVRSSKNNSFAVLFLVCSMFVVCLSAILIVKNGGFLGRSINNKQNLHNLYKSDFSLPLLGKVFADKSCKELVNKDFFKAVTCRTNSTNPELLIIGDSHAATLYSSIGAGKINMPTLMVQGLSYFELIKNADQPFLSESIKELGDAAKISSVKNILIVNLSPDNDLMGGAEKELFVTAYSNLLKELYKLNKKVIFVLDVPRLDKNPHECVRRVGFLQYNIEDADADCSIDFVKFQSGRLGYLNAVSELKDGYPQLKLYDASKSLCDGLKCYAKDEMDFLYFDDNHITIHASEKILANLLNDPSIIGD